MLCSLSDAPHVLLLRLDRSVNRPASPERRFRPVIGLQPDALSSCVSLGAIPLPVMPDAKRKTTGGGGRLATKQIHASDPTTKSACTVTSCHHAARLDCVLVENAFLGETVDGLQGAVQASDRQRDQLQAEIDRLQCVVDDLTERCRQGDAAVAAGAELDRRLADADRRCQALRDDKTELIEQSWMALQQLGEFRRQNDGLIGQVRRLQDELDREQIGGRQRQTNRMLEKVRRRPSPASLIVATKVEWLKRRRPRPAGNEFEAIASEIEILEAQALASARLQLELDAEQRRSERLRQRLEQAEAGERDARALIVEHVAREAKLLEHLKRAASIPIELARDSSRRPGGAAD